MTDTDIPARLTADPPPAAVVEIDAKKGGSASATLDPADYLADLSDLDLTESQKIELLTTLHDILSHFVRLGFDLDGVDVCGQLFGDFHAAASGGADGVESGNSITLETPTDQTEEDTR